MHAALSPKAHLGAPQYGWRAPTPSAGAPARPAGRKLAVWCQAASGNGNGNGNGTSGAVGVEAERMRFAEEQSETAKMDQASILRKRAADALSAQRRLMEARVAPGGVVISMQWSKQAFARCDPPALFPPGACRFNTAVGRTRR